MIRYQQTRESLEAEIGRSAPKWLARAARRTNRFLAAAAYAEKTSIWTEVKHIYIRLQRRKCAFCERALAASGIEHDVEHFRPKNAVKPWPTAAQTYDFPTGPTHPSGYYWLAYDIENYAAACKDCNTLRKSNFFPIARQPGPALASPRDLNAVEEPFLFYPITDCDPDDPEELIVFDGVVALPRDKSGRAYQRARITIDFFRLNDREELLEERSRTIREIVLALGNMKEGADPRSKQVGLSTLQSLRSAAAPHASCGRCYMKLVQTDPDRAWTIYKAADRLLAPR